MTTPASVTLSPDARLPLLVVVLGVALLPLPLSPWPTVVVVLFGVFLLIQTASLRLEFEERALIVWQNGREHPTPRHLQKIQLQRLISSSPSPLPL